MKKQGLETKKAQAGAGAIGQVVESSPIVSEALGSIPSVTEKMQGMGEGRKTFFVLHPLFLASFQLHSERKKEYFAKMDPKHLEKVGCHQTVK